MTSKLKVNIIADGGDNAIMTSDGSGSLTLNNAALKNTPAFHAKLTTSHSLVHATATKVQFNTEVFDTDSAYDHSTNYRFTVPSGKAGKYFIYYQLRASSTGTTWYFGRLQLYKNGSAFSDNAQNNSTSSLHASNFFNGTIALDLSAGDYLELYCTLESSDSSNGSATIGSPGEQTIFGAYRLIGA